MSTLMRCVKNSGYPVSLEIGKVYQVWRDSKATARHFVRIKDESGEDFLYPAEYFVAIKVPPSDGTMLEEARGLVSRDCSWNLRLTYLL
jgi:hypothetical protein